MICSFIKCQRWPPSSAAATHSVADGNVNFFGCAKTVGVGVVSAAASTTSGVSSVIGSSSSEVVDCSGLSASSSSADAAISVMRAAWKAGSLTMDSSFQFAALTTVVLPSCSTSVGSIPMLTLSYAPIFNSSTMSSPSGYGRSQQ